MVKWKPFFLSLLLLCAFIPIVVPYAEAAGSQELWALIICGSADETFSNNTQYMYHVLTQNYTFNGIYYLDVYTNRPGVNASATKNHVRLAINTTLASWSDSNDIVFIYYSSHGGGYHIEEGWEVGRIEFPGDENNEVREDHFRVANLLPRFGLRPWPLNTLIDYEGNSSAGYHRSDGILDDRICDFWIWNPSQGQWERDGLLEVDIDNDGTINWRFEYYWDLDRDGNFDDFFADLDGDDQCDILIDLDTDGDGIPDDLTIDGEDVDNDGYIVGVDLNNNGNTNDWVGIDECMEVEDGLYWDDELASDLNTLSYAKLIFVRQGCVEESKGCFGGGIIDDISAPNRIIMTASNETSHSFGPRYGSYSFWSEAFINALHGQKTHYDPINRRVVHDPVYVDADLNNDGHVSMWEAFQYAWLNDEARLSGLETPWIDDNGNGLPTYSQERDNPDFCDGPQSCDGLLAWETYFGFEKLKTPDIYEDQKVDMKDMGRFAKAFGGFPGHPRWNPDADLYIDNKNDMKDIGIAAKMWHKYYSTGSSSSSTNSPVVTVYPNETTTCTQELFSVNITITNATDIYGYEFMLYYNSNVINCTGVEIPPGHFLEPIIDLDNIFTVRQEYDNSFNSTHGLVWVGLCLLGEEPGKNGSGTLATINFEAIAAGSSPLNLQYTMFINTSTNAIPIIVVDGSVTVLPLLTVLAEDQYGNALTSGDVYIDDQLTGYTGSIFNVSSGTHKVWVNDFWENGTTGYRYGWKNWTDGSVDNPRNITVLEDTTITAYFFKKWCPGDVNGDSKVDMKDIGFVAYRFGSIRGDSKWDSRADLNCDSKIDMKDQGIVARYFGKSYE